MTAVAVILGCALLLLLAGERFALRRARLRLRHVIHVNGTRGKSSTARLIGAGLAAAGLRVITKTTGTEARWIDVDGTERRLLRLGPPSVGEQARLLLRAARQRADALVVECMAVAPALQRASEGILAADIAVITNVRRDHEEALGSDPVSMARGLCAMLPRGGKLVTAEQALLPVLEEQAAAAGCSVTSVRAEASRRIGDFPDNRAVALAVCGLCGVDEAAASSGFATHRPDPGALRVVSWTSPAGAAISLLDALAANDADSAEPLVTSFFESLQPGVPRILLLAARGDRPLRTLQLARLAAATGAGELWVNPAGFLIARRAGARPRLVLRPDCLDRLAGPAGVAAVGNTHGFGGSLRSFLGDVGRG